MMCSRFGLILCCFFLVCVLMVSSERLWLFSIIMLCLCSECISCSVFSDWLLWLIRLL